MPEHHARRIFLKVPEFELHAEISVVEIVHGCVPCDGKKRGRRPSKSEKAPSVAGGAFFWVKYAVSSARNQKAIRRKRSPWWSMLLIEACSCSVYGGGKPPGQT